MWKCGTEGKDWSRSKINLHPFVEFVEDIKQQTSDKSQAAPWINSPLPHPSSLPLSSQPPISARYWSAWPREHEWDLLCFYTTVTSELWPSPPYPTPTLAHYPSSHPLLRYTSFAHHLPALPWWRPPTSLRHLHLLSVKQVGSFFPLNTTFTFQNMWLQLNLRTGSCGIIFCHGALLW